MRIRNPSILTATILIIGLWAPVLAGSGDGFICFPGAPKAGEAGDRVAAALAKRLLAEQAGAARYFHERAAGERWLSKEKAGWGLIGFELYLAWRQSGRKLQALAAAEVDGQSARPFLLVAPKDSKRQSLADFAGVELQTNLIRDPRFIRALVFKGRGQEIKLRWIDRPLRGLKNCARGKIEGMIIDEEQWAGIQKMSRYGSRLKRIYTSEPLPKALVVAFEPCQDQHRKDLAAALLGLDKDDEGRKLLKTLRVTGFRAPPEPAKLDALLKRYSEQKP